MTEIKEIRIESLAESEPPVYVHHHLKYKEIHGKDEIIIIEKGKHHALHDALRKDKKCNVPVDILSKISDNAYGRRVMKRLHFRETVLPNVLLVEAYQYNTATGTLTISSQFEANNSKELIYLDGD